MSLDKTLLGVAKSAVDTQRKSRDGRNVVSKGVDAVTNKSYANEDKKVAAAALRKWENEVWKPKTEARLKQEMSERVSHLKPGSDAYNQTYQSLYNKNHQGLQAAKAKAYQQLGTLRQKGQTQRQVDNRYTQKESLRNNTAKIQSAASVGRDVAEEAAGALATGTSRALRYPLQLAADIGENDDGGIFDRGAKALERHEDNLQQVYPAYADTQQNGSFTENLTLSAIEQIPNLALSFTGAGAAAKGAQLAGAGAKMTAATAYGTAAATMYPQAYGDGNDSTKQELENATPEQLATAVRSKDIYKGHFDKNIKAGMSEDEAYQKARDQTISSIAEESGDAVGLATLALSMLAPGVGSFTANRAAGGAVSKWGQKVFNTLAVKADAGKVAKVAIPAAVGTGIVGLNFAEEALQEGFTDKVAQQAAVDVGVKDKIDTAQTKEAMLMGGILGAAMGGGVYVGTRNSKLHQAQDDLKTAQQAYAEVAGQIPQLQQQIEEVSPRSPQGQALTAQLEETRSVLDAMATEAEKSGIPRTSLARRAPRIDPTSSAASDFDGQVEGATELSEQDFENALNPGGTPATQAPVVQPMSEAELDAQDAQLAELIAEQAALDEAIEDGSNEKPLEESIAAAQSWYDSKRGEGKQGLAGVVSRAAATEQDAAFAQQQEAIKGTTTSINDYIASERAKQQQIEVQLQQEAQAATTDAEKQAVAQKIEQREINRAKEDELLSSREQLAQPYENESFDTTVIAADGAPFNLARFWDSNMPAAAKAKAIADAFGGQVDQNVAKADWQSMPEGVQKELHRWFDDSLAQIRQKREAQLQQPAEQQEAENKAAVSEQLKDSPLTSGLTMPVRAEQAPVKAEQEAASYTLDNLKDDINNNYGSDPQAMFDAQKRAEEAGLPQPEINRVIQETISEKVGWTKPVQQLAAEQDMTPPGVQAKIDSMPAPDNEGVIYRDGWRTNIEEARVAAYGHMQNGRLSDDDVRPYWDNDIDGLVKLIDSVRNKDAQSPTQLTNENPVINIPAPITDEPALIELQAPVADEVNTEQPPITVERYKSKPAARAAIKKQKIDPQSVSIVSMEDGYAIVEAGTNQTEQADESVAPMQEQQAELANTESVATDAIELTEQNPVINIPAPVVSKSATEPASTTAKIYKSKPAAQAAIKKQKLSPDSVTIKQVKGGGFEIVPNAPAKPSYAQAQEQAATELGMTLNEDGEYGGTDAEFETFAERVDEIQGRSLSNSKPTPKQNAAVPTDDVAIGKDGLAKWFGSNDKAQAFIDKKGISDTHEVVSAGKSRFEIQPKAQTTGATNQTSTPTDVISENGSPDTQELTATSEQSAPAKRAEAKKAVKNRASEENQKVSNAEDLKPVQSEDMVTTNSASETKSTAVEVEADKQPSSEKSGEKAAKKADKPAAPIETVAEIKDFGEKITGARKDMDSFYQREITDDDISSQPLSKIWPKKDVEAIEDKQTAALATVLRGTIPSKPRKGYKLNTWVEQVKNARGIMQQMMGDDTLVGQFIDKMTHVKGLQTTGYHAQLLNHIDRDNWSRVTAVDHRPYYTIKNDDGSTSPDMSFDVTIDKRRHVIPTDNKQISEVVSKVNELLSGEVKAPTLKFDLYSRGRGDAKSWFITQTSDKDKTPLITFNDRDSARAFLKENNNELSELWEQHKEKVNVKKTDTRSRQNRERIGPDHRSGQDVTTEQFMKAFGLRGGQFGNWVKQGANSKDRQGMLNDAYDAFMDLAGVLNIPSEAIGLGGKLGMSFGARGKGSAMAHYEPSQVVINLTKTKGAGTLAHEWFHALDHHFTSFRDSPARNKSREDTYITYKPEPSMMYTPQKGRGYLISKPALEKRRANSKEPMYAAENWAPDPSHPEGVRPKVEEAFADLVNALNDSPMKDRATTIDKGATDGYWSRIIERAARSFESYIIHKLKQQGARSDFLANVTPENAFPRNMDRYPYLLESEIAPVAEAFDNLFATIDSKASEDGNGKILFSRAGQMKQAAESITTNPAKGNTGTTAKQVVSTLQKRFGKEVVAALIKSGKLRVRTLNDFVNADGRLLIPSDAEGFYYDGKVTLIADNLTADNAIATLLHEMGGHAGIQSMLAPQTYMGLMANFDNLVKSGNKYAVKAKERAEAVTDTESEARDEYIPYLITEYAQATERGGPLAVIKRFVNRVLAGVRAWVRNHTGVQLKMTPNDIVQLAERMVKRLSDQEASPLNIAGIGNMPAGQAQFSQAPAPQSQVDAVRKQYEGTDSWMKAPNGLPSKLTELQWLQVRTPSFKNWFGDWENGQRTENATGLNERADRGVRQNKRGKPNEAITRSMDDAGSNGERDSRDTGNKRQSDSPNSSKHNPQRIFNLDPETGEPRVLSHGTRDKFFIFDSAHANKKDFGWLGVGHYFATDEPLARLYAFNKKGNAGLSVMNVYLNARNPFVATQSLKNMIRDGGKAEAEEFTQYLIDNGHDSVVLDNGADNLEVMVLDANQVKSATDNVGTFDGSNPDIRFSRRYSSLGTDGKPVTAKEKARDRVALAQATTMSSKFGVNLLLRRHLATPQHVALLNPVFKIFTDNVQARIAYENNEAGLVQTYLPEIWDTRLVVGKKKEAMERVSKAIFDGTMADKVWDDNELQTMFDLTDKDINLYRRARQAIDGSVLNMTVDTLSALAKGTKLVSLPTVQRLKLAGLPPIGHNLMLQQHMTDELEKLAKGGLITPKAEARMQKQLDAVFDVMNAVAGKYDKLVEDGYAPLMRFGHYAVEVRDKVSNDLDLFELYETKGQQRKAIKELKERYDESQFTIGTGTLNPEGFKQFKDKGLSPETVQLFAAELGLDDDGAYQAYLKIAVSDRSALKRLIHRKKVPGYSEDMPRVLSSFVMSNARYSGRSLYNNEIERSIQNIEDGNLQNEAQKVFENMENPQEEFAQQRSLMFHYFMGFSPAFLFLNLTQPFTQTIPKLTAYVGAGKGHAYMAQALGIVSKNMGASAINMGKKATGLPTPNWKGFEDSLPAWVKKEDYLRMAREGHLDPQNIYMIKGLERGKGGVASGVWGNIEAAAGWPAEVSESINRRSTMIAAFRVAKDMGAAKLKAKGFDSDYDFAVSIIQQTQGIYNKANRSGLARGNGKLGQYGPLILVFKQFTINYTEQMIRHGRDKEVKSLAVAMMWQFALAGMLGLPFADDLRDIFEGIAYRVFGKAFNLPDYLEGLLGKSNADALMYGIASEKGRIDIFGRSSLGNVIPGTDVIRPGPTDWAEILGASSGFYESFFSAASMAADGKYKDALITASPRYIRDAASGAEIALTGSYRNTKGDKIMDLDKTDAVIKSLAFNPSNNARPGRDRSNAYQMKNMLKAKTDYFSKHLAEAIYQDDDERVDALYNEMDAWNERNAEHFNVDIDKIEKSAEKRVERKDFGSAERQNIQDSLALRQEELAGT